MLDAFDVEGEYMWVPLDNAKQLHAERSHESEKLLELPLQSEVIHHSFIYSHEMF